MKSRRHCLVALCGLATVACGKKSETAAQQTTPETAASNAASAAEPPAPLDRVRLAKTMNDALAIAKPEMEDSFQNHSLGTRLLAYWAADNLRLPEVAVAKNETSFGLIKKDTEAELGKRMCVRGEIIQIAKQTLVDRKLFWGLVRTYSDHLVSFWAAGSTGTLVERRSSRFCGVVTGEYDYTNSRGGTGHSVELVGLFDIAENRDNAEAGTGQGAQAAGAN